MSSQFSPYQIVSALDRLGIKHEGSQPNSKGWLSVLCPNPSHHDHNFGNCSINLNSGFVKCFRCGYGDKGNAKSIIDIVKDNMGFDFKQAKQFIEEGLFASQTQSYIEPEKPKRKRVKPLYNFTSLDFNPEDYYYTHQRGFTKEFCDAFKIKHAVSGWFNDYFIIPIVDTAKGINEYEARRLKEYETLCDFYEVENASFSKLKKNFGELCINNHIRLNKKTYQVMLDTVVIEDERIKYLLKPKTLYISNSRCQETLWNIDNLNYDESLYIVEGLGSIPKIYENISHNVTSFFGVSITDTQIDYMNKFKSIIHIPDYDQAGYDSVDFLRYKLKVPYEICDSVYEDTDEEFVNDIKNKTLLSPERYVSKYFFQFRAKSLR